MGANNSVNLAGTTNEYFHNQAIKILLPKNLQPLAKGMGVMGYRPKFGAFVLSMNAAAPSGKKDLRRRNPLNEH